MQPKINLIPRVLKQQYTQSVARLQRIIKGEYSPIHGLCSTALFPIPSTRVSEIFKGWPSHSGDNSYPVPSQASDMSAEDYYNMRQDMYDKSTTYGALRLSLAEYSLQKIGNMIEATERVEDAIDKLRELCINRSPRDISVGLCSNYLQGIPKHIIWKTFESWEHFSGDKHFPIAASKSFVSRCRNKEFCTEWQYYHAAGKFSMYNRRTTYGKRRYQLAEHVADTLDKMLGLKLTRVETSRG